MQKFKDIIFSKLIDVKDDGSFKLNMDYFNYATGLTMTNHKFAKLFNIERRNPENKLLQIHMDIAASIQAATEEVVLKITKFLAETIVDGESSLLKWHNTIKIIPNQNEKIQYDETSFEDSLAQGSVHHEDSLSESIHDVNDIECTEKTTGVINPVPGIISTIEHDTPNATQMNTAIEVVNTMKQKHDKYQEIVDLRNSDKGEQIE